MVMTQGNPRGHLYACKHARTPPRVFVDIRAGIPAKMVVVIWFRFDDVSRELCPVTQKEIRPPLLNNECWSELTKYPLLFVIYIYYLLY
jgi:hypothetical protein